MKKYEKICFSVFNTVLSVIMITAILFYIFYIKTDMGFASSYDGYTSIFAPIWLEVLIITISIPTFIGISIYNK